MGPLRTPRQAGRMVDGRHADLLLVGGDLRRNDGVRFPLPSGRSRQGQFHHHRSGEFLLQLRVGIRRLWRAGIPQAVSGRRRCQFRRHRPVRSGPPLRSVSRRIVHRTRRIVLGAIPLLQSIPPRDRQRLRTDGGRRVGPQGFRPRRHGESSDHCVRDGIVRLHGGIALRHRFGIVLPGRDRFLRQFRDAPRGVRQDVFGGMDLRHDRSDRGLGIEGRPCLYRYYVRIGHGRFVHLVRHGRRYRPRGIRRAVPVPRRGHVLLRHSARRTRRDASREGMDPSDDPEGADAGERVEAQGRARGYRRTAVVRMGGPY
mmetsp:Transcript_22659/g.67063  ORF Transcript_22659/g.67063 Transcript_22659/m.67063 type:complete len:314 (-) Transcript_22659:386-1327(-)